MSSNSSVNLQQSAPALIEALRMENGELINKLLACEHNLLVSEKRAEVFEGEVNRLIKENHDLIYSIERQRSQKLNFMQNAQEIKNELTLEGAEAQKFESQNKRLNEDNERLKKELETSKIEKLHLTKEKQNSCNKLIVAEARLEALTMQESFINASLTQTATQNFRLKEQVNALNKRLNESSGGYVKTILKDSNQTKKQLLTEFQQKIYNKQLANHEEIQRYEAKISQLNLLVAQLQSQLASK